VNRWLAVAAAAAVGAGGVLVASQASAHDDTVRTSLRDPRGVHVGSVVFTDEGDATSVKAVLKRNRYVTPRGAFHGFHVHANNNPANGAGCVADPSQKSSTWFVSADGHLAETGQTHGKHDGDMPSPLVLADGSAHLRFTTDRVDLPTLVGKAVILHADADNFGNVPTGEADDQYKANTQAAIDRTQSTGNAGDRVACGLLRRR
jgi:Cu-Zn family superoxide dismutase